MEKMFIYIFFFPNKKESLFCGYSTKDVLRAKVFPTEAQKLQTRGCLTREQKVEGVKNVIGGGVQESRETSIL